MSFRSHKDTISYGDTVLLHIGYDNMLPFIVRKGKTHQTKFGAVRHDSLVGKRYGSKLQCPRGWVYVIQPTPELWTLSLPHRTQILYSTDISMIIFQLDLKPGSVVAEAGTGSGSLSHAIIRTIMPMGYLHTFEFHEERSKVARGEFSTHGLGDFVSVTHRDVCGDGFQLDHIVDAVFLDLPRPWECIASAKKAIKTRGGRLCTFSPCIEQVQRTCEELTSHGFTEIVTMECLARNFNVQHAKLQNLQFGDDETLSAADKQDSKTQQSSQDLKHLDSIEKDAPPSKSIKTENSDAKETNNKNGKKSEKKNSGMSKDSKSGASSMHCFDAAVPALAMQGHTGFLTFASLGCQ